MAITTCTKCGNLYNAGSEEQANEPVRVCWKCQEKVNKVHIDDENLPVNGCAVMAQAT